ncbi:MAG: hypothetical protein H7839_24460 [Magnetococcus sp. YQC-5]
MAVDDGRDGVFLIGEGGKQGAATKKANIDRVGWPAIGIVSEAIFVQNDIRKFHIGAKIEPTIWMGEILIMVQVHDTIQ